MLVDRDETIGEVISMAEQLQPEERVNWTATRATEFDLPPQGDGESDKAFRERISSALRDMGFPIEAHEAYQNALYDDPNVLTGLYGVAAQAIVQDYGKTDGDRVGDDIAAGHIVRAPKQESDPLLLLLATFMR